MVSRNFAGVLDSKKAIVVAEATYPTDGLVARWTFNDTLVSSVNNYALSVLSGGTEAYANGKVGKAFSFNGSTMLQNSDIYTTFSGTSSFSISLWTKINSGDWADPWLISGNDGGSYQKEVFIIGETTSKIYAGRHSPGVSMYGASTSISNIFDNNWHHIVYTYNGTTISIYTDNNTPNTTVPGAISINMIKFNVGGYAAGSQSARMRNGSLLDSLYVYSRALNSTEISVLYNGGNGA